MRVTATEAKNRFGSLCAQAKREPVFVEKAGQLDTVILSAEQYQALKANQDKASVAARKKAFEAEYGDWIAVQNALFDTHGIPGADLRPCATAGIPYVVVVQSDLLDSLATRLTMPLAVLDVATKVPTVLCPIIIVKGQRLHALAHYAAPLPATALRRSVENVASQASALVSALDAVLSGI